jgi:hypothetical protein
MDTKLWCRVLKGINIYNIMVYIKALIYFLSSKVGYTSSCVGLVKS